MSTLDELKKQASEATLRNQAGKSAGPSEQDQWRQLAAVMKFLKDHFTELAETLNVLDKDTLVDFQINDSVTMKRLKCENYKITHPGPEKERDWVFEFENGAEHPTYSVVPVGSAASNFKDTLVNNQIRCLTTPVDGNKSVKFEIKPPVRTKYRFTADLEKGRIKITISNYSNLWTQTSYLKKTDITQELMDELTKHVMREPNKYNEMVGNTLSDEARIKLRQKLQEDITAKKKQAAKADARLKKQQQGKKEKTLFGKFFKKK